MKQIQLTLLVVLVTVFSFYSCQDETVDNQQSTTTESVAITNAMNALQDHFDAQGNLQNGQNPTNNIIFDFCFNFVYPITLSYNTGTEVTVADFDGLVDILINSTDTLYINGIAFPFQVESFNENTNAFEILTVENEADFTQLLDTCSIDENGQVASCDCPDTYDPVCVAITDSNGEINDFTFPNMCYAACEGFTAADVVDCDYSNASIDYLFNDCFDFVYPVSLTLSTGEVVTLNNDDDLATALYIDYTFDFVYPISVEDSSTGVTTTLTSSGELVNLLNDCNGGNNNGCGISDINITVGSCISATAYQITVDFDHTNYTATDFIIELADGTTTTYNISDLPIQLNVDTNPSGTDSLAIRSTNSNCADDVSWDVPNC